MKRRLPVYIENLELPKEENRMIEKEVSYGYVSIMYILSLLITFGSVIVVLLIRK